MKQYKKVFKEQEPEQTDESPSKLLDRLHYLLKMYLKQNGVATNRADILASNLLNVASRLSQSKYPPQVEKLLNRYLDKFYTQIHI